MPLPLLRRRAVVEMLNEAPVSASTTTTTTTTTLTTLTSATSSVAEDQSLTTQVVESEQQQETVTNSQTVEQVPIQDGVDVVAEKIPAEVFFCVFFLLFYFSSFGTEVFVVVAFGPFSIRPVAPLTSRLFRSKSWSLIGHLRLGLALIVFSFCFFLSFRRRLTTLPPPRPKTRKPRPMLSSRTNQESTLKQSYSRRSCFFFLSSLPPPHPPPRCRD